MVPAVTVPVLTSICPPADKLKVPEPTLIPPARLIVSNSATVALPPPVATLNSSAAVETFTVPLLVVRLTSPAVGEGLPDPEDASCADPLIVAPVANVVKLMPPLAVMV